MESGPHILGVRSLSHWTTREAPCSHVLESHFLSSNLWLELNNNYSLAPHHKMKSLSSVHRIPQSAGSGCSGGRSVHLLGIPREHGRAALSSRETCRLSSTLPAQGTHLPPSTRSLKGPGTAVLLQGPKGQRLCLPTQESSLGEGRVSASGAQKTQLRGLCFVIRGDGSRGLGWSLLWDCSVIQWSLHSWGDF